MPQERFPKQALLAKLKGKRPVDDHEHAGKTTLRILVGTTWGFNQAICDMLKVVADRDVWRLNLERLPPQPSRT